MSTAICAGDLYKVNGIMLVVLLFNVKSMDEEDE